MKYCITMEKTQRVAVWFEAEDTDDAIAKGNSIFEEHKLEEDSFSGGDLEYNYAISTDGTDDIVPW